MTSDQFNFQFCQKLVVFSNDGTSVLLCKRKGEEDFDGTYSFIGGKLEVTDESTIAGLKREKDEEVGESCILTLFPTFSTNILFKKADGSSMILPHYYAQFESGDIVLSEECSEYTWVPIFNLELFEPKVPNIPEVVKQLQLLTNTVSKLESVQI